MWIQLIRRQTMNCHLLLLPLLLAASVRGLDLTILHTNDVHARIEQTSAYSSKCSGEDAAENQCFGGVARLHTALDAIRNTPQHVLLLDGGDQFQGTLWFNQYHGSAASHFMNRNGYDAMALGNHEFDNGAAGLVDFLQNATFPVLSCNIDASRDLHLNGRFQKSAVFTFDGERVGVVGYTTSDTAFLVNKEGIENITFNDEVSSIQQEVNILISSGINNIIVLGHGGYDVDMRIAREVTGVDVIVGGHTNTFLYSEGDEELPSIEEAAGAYPTVIRHADGRDVLVVQAYAYGKYLGFLQVTFDDAGQVTEWDGNPILLDGSIAQDPEVLAEVLVLAAPLEELRNTVVGRSAVFLEHRPLCRLGECALGNVISDALVTEFMEVPEGPGEPWTDVSLVMLNSGGLRAAAEQGAITMEDVLFILPFRNEVERVTLSGQTILEALEFSASKYDELSPRGAFLVLGGFRVVYDVRREVGQRVTSAQVRCADCNVPFYYPLDVTETYNVLTNTYLAGGGDGYSMISDNIIETRYYGSLLSDTFANYLRKRSPVIHGMEGRIKVIKEGTPDTSTSQPSVTVRPSEAPMHSTEAPIPPSGAQPVILHSAQSALCLIAAALSVVLMR